MRGQINSSWEVLPSPTHERMSSWSGQVWYHHFPQHWGLIVPGRIDGDIRDRFFFLKKKNIQYLTVRLDTADSSIM